MKKLMTLAVFTAVAVSVQGATINWGLGADVYLMETGKDYTTAELACASTLTPASGSYLALVYVGQGVNSFDIGNITSASVIDTMPYALDTDGSTYAEWDPQNKPIDVTDTTSYPDTASFGVVWFNGESFDYVYSIDDGSALNNATIFADMTRGNDWVLPAGNTSGYGGILTVSASTPVIPEPGIACMALLGIGMMIKRRKA